MQTGLAALPRTETFDARRAGRAWRRARDVDVAVTQQVAISPRAASSGGRGPHPRHGWRQCQGRHRNRN